MPPIIEVKNLSKKYRITHARGGYVTLRDVLANIAKSPLRFLASKTKQIAGKSTKEDFWALKDVNFDVAQGEVVGVIGHNGAGKSTLLKILSRITPPTSGEVRLRGRVGSLLEVGTGFHPELTGRENIFLNGAILGMKRSEIVRKFDEIVEFSGVEKFLDTPVKYYSSGMYVRLAFSVAAHLEPDILLVDEVLAVGDAEFQKKCLNKMESITTTAGRTILFISHNMDAIRKLCTRTILIEQGKIRMIGDTNEVINLYLNNPQTLKQGVDLKARHDRKGAGHLKVTSFFIEEGGKRVSTLRTGGQYTLCFEYVTDNSSPIHNVDATFAIANEAGYFLINGSTSYVNSTFPSIPSKGVIRCEIIQKLPLNAGIYVVAVDIFADGTREDHIKNLAVIQVDEGDFYGTGVITSHSPINVDQVWNIQATTP